MMDVESNIIVEYTSYIEKRQHTTWHVIKASHSEGRHSWRRGKKHISNTTSCPFPPLLPLLSYLDLPNISVLIEDLSDGILNVNINFRE